MHQRTPLSQREACGRRGGPGGPVPGPGGFRTIQVSPKDLPAVSGTDSRRLKVVR